MLQVGNSLIYFLLQFLTSFVTQSFLPKVHLSKTLLVVGILWNMKCCCGRYKQQVVVLVSPVASW